MAALGRGQIDPERDVADQVAPDRQLRSGLEGRRHHELKQDRHIADGDAPARAGIEQHEFVVHYQPEIDLTTIYRNLDLFTHDGLVKKLNLGDGEAQYEYKEDDHHHAICIDCDKVIHFTAPDEKIMELLEVKDFKPDGLEITLRGKCAQHK